MTQKPVSLEVYILDKAYRIACNEGEQDELMASARLLNDHMRQVRGAGRVISHDRVAVMAGLNLAHDLLACRRSAGGVDPNLGDRLSVLSEHITAALNNGTESEV